jgi:hypothetical protein
MYPPVDVASLLRAINCSPYLEALVSRIGRIAWSACHELLLRYTVTIESSNIPEIHVGPGVERDLDKLDLRTHWTTGSSGFKDLTSPSVACVQNCPTTEGSVVSCYVFPPSHLVPLLQADRIQNPFACRVVLSSSGRAGIDSPLSYFIPDTESQRPSAHRESLRPSTKAP